MLLHFDFSSDVPIYMQIRNQIVIGIANGDLQYGEKLPTIRSMANEAGINMMTVSKAYQLLKSEGYIETDRRSGAVVRGKAKQTPEMDAKVREELRVIAAQAKLSGITKEGFTAACAEAYERG